MKYVKYFSQKIVVFPKRTEYIYYAIQTYKEPINLSGNDSAYYLGPP